MRNMPGRYGFILVALFTMIGGGVWPVQAESFSRISDIQGSLNLKGRDDENWTPATVNLLLKEEDRLETGIETTAEIEMPGLARIQMGRLTTIEVKGYGGADSRDELVLESGGVFIEDRDGTTVVETASAAVSPNSGSTVRIDLDRDGTRVRVVSGSAQIQPFSNGRYVSRPMLLRVGEEMVVDRNSQPEGPRSYIAEGDALDRYRQRRAQALGLAVNDRNDDRKEDRKKESHLDQPLMGSDELVGNGQWVTVGGGFVWRPYVTSGWRPYFNGYWAWYNPFGWTWVSYDPFGYVTFHYGGWIYDPFFGWCWVPGYTWRPAYVSWVAVGPYYAWAPLDPFGRVVVINRINVQVFMVAPKRIFVGNHPSARPIGGRFIPPGMRSNGSIQVADARIFQGAYPVEPIKNFNTAQPVGREDGSGLIGRTFTALKGHPGPTGIPRPAQPITREIHGFKRGYGPTTQEGIDRSRFPRTGRTELPARNGGIQNPTVGKRPFFTRGGVVRPDATIERRPGRVQSIHPSAIVRKADSRRQGIPITGDEGRPIYRERFTP